MIELFRIFIVIISKLYFATLVAFQEAVATQVVALVLSCVLLATDSTLFEKKFSIPLIWFLPFANSFFECFTL